MHVDMPGKLLSALVLFTCNTTTLAASSTIGSTAAVQCYQESLFPMSERGIQYCNEAIKRGNLTKRNLAATYSNRGIIYLKNGKFQKALKDHNKAARIKPDLAQVYINRGNVFYHTHEYENALAEFDKAIVTGGGPVSVSFHNKALTLIKLHRIAEAKRALEMGLEVNPHSKKIQDRLNEIAEFSDML